MPKGKTGKTKGHKALWFVAHKHLRLMSHRPKSKSPTLESLFSILRRQQEIRPETPTRALASHFQFPVDWGLGSPKMKTTKTPGACRKPDQPPRSHPPPAASSSGRRLLSRGRRPRTSRRRASLAEAVPWMFMVYVHSER